MWACEGKLGRVFFLRFESNEAGKDALERFAKENGIDVAIVSIMGDTLVTGVLSPNALSQPEVVFANAFVAESFGWHGKEGVVQEIFTDHDFTLVAEHAVTVEVPVSKARVVEKTALLRPRRVPLDLQWCICSIQSSTRFVSKTILGVC